MQLGYAVYAVGSSAAEVSHVDLTALDNGHLGNSVAVLGSVEQILAVAAVDLADDGVDSREDLLNEALIPLLKRLSHNGVVGVSEGVGNDVPSLLPAVAALVEEYSHQLRDSEGRVSIVDVDSNLLVEVLQCAVYVHVAHYDIADGSGAHEILLAQTERLALEVVIVRVKDLGNSVSDVVSAHSLGVVAGVEAVHIEGHGLGAPQTELGNALAVVAGNVHIVGNSVYCGVVDVLEVVVVILPVLVDLTIEVYLDSLVGNRNEPSAAAGEPVIGKLGLPAVNDLLLEDTVLITDRVTGSGIVAGSEAVHVAGCKSAQTAVAEACVRFLVVNAVYLDAHIIEGFLSNVLHAEVVEAGLEGAAHQELHGEVVNLLSALGVAVVHKVVTLFLEVVDYNGGKCAVNLCDSSVLCVGTEIEFQYAVELSLQFILSKRRIHSFC